MKRRNTKVFERSSLQYLLTTSSLNSFKYLESERRFLPIFIWIWVNLLLVGLSIILLNTLWEQLTANPTVTYLESATFPVSEVPFPAIGVCNLNKISRRKVTTLATFLSKNTRYDIETIKEYMQALGSFYDFDHTKTPKLLTLQKILEQFPQIEHFRPGNLIKWLAPSCDDLIINCSWKNEHRNCSELFQQRLSFEGSCCMFNYVKNTVENISDNFRNKKIMSGDAGINYGLTIELNNQIDDYFYTQHASLGANIHIFNPDDYPDKNSGGLTEQLVGLSREFYMQLETIGFRSVPEVIDYSVDKRMCYFEFEKTTAFGLYSESDCLVDCRIKSMIGLCGCVPFMIPQNRSRVCGFSDMHCLNKFRNKWESLAPPDGFQEASLLREAHHSLRCERCYPVCESFLYNMATNNEPFPSFGNNSLLHIYYVDRFSTIYKQDIQNYWFEIISKLGSLFGLMLGASLVSLLEIIVSLAHKAYKLFEETKFDDDFCECCIWTI